MQTEKAALRSRGLCDEVRRLVAEFNAGWPGCCFGPYRYYGSGSYCSNCGFDTEYDDSAVDYAYNGANPYTPGRFYTTLVCCQDCKEEHESAFPELAV